MVNHDRKRIILDRENKSPYLTRYYLFLKDRKRFPFNVFLHNFHRSDPDDLHDHPFGYATFIIKGGYYEWVPVFNDTPNPTSNDIIGETRVWRGPGHFRICRANSFHRIELKPDTDCWTLFMPGPQIREWGFLKHLAWKPGTFTWVRYDQYLEDKHGKA